MKVLPPFLANAGDVMGQRSVSLTFRLLYNSQE